MHHMTNEERIEESISSHAWLSIHNVPDHDDDNDPLPLLNRIVYFATESSEQRRALINGGNRMAQELSLIKGIPNYHTTNTRIDSMIIQWREAIRDIETLADHHFTTITMHTGESLTIGDDIHVTTFVDSDDTIRICVDAPDQLKPHIENNDDEKH